MNPSPSALRLSALRLPAEQIWHLAKRFVGSVRPGPPSAPDRRWARSQLTAGEQEIWDRMSNPDRRHAVGVAQAVVDALGVDAERPVVAAALLHDSGKVVSGLRTPARVAATVVWAVTDDDRAERWAAGSSGVKQKLGQYRRHPELGADLLAAAGSDPVTVTWTREHHRPADQWSLDARLATVLKACDDD